MRRPKIILITDNSAPLTSWFDDWSTTCPYRSSCCRRCDMLAGSGSCSIAPQHDTNGQSIVYAAVCRQPCTWMLLICRRCSGPRHDCADPASPLQTNGDILRKRGSPCQYLVRSGFFIPDRISESRTVICTQPYVEGSGLTSLNAAVLPHVPFRDATCVFPKAHGTVSVVAATGEKQATILCRHSHESQRYKVVVIEHLRHVWLKVHHGEKRSA